MAARGLFALACLTWIALLLAAGVAPRDPDTLVVGIGADPASLDPARPTGVPEGRILRALFEGLTVADPDTLAPLPGVARAWEISPDGLRYRFELRPDARWSNGDPVTADDFRFSWLRLLDPAEACQNAPLLWPVRGARAYTEGSGAREEVAIRAPSPDVLEVELASPAPHFLPLTAYYPLSPVHPPSVAASGGSALLAPDRLVSNGPYRLAGRWLRDRVRVERSELYWDAGAVEIPRIDYLAAESPTTLLNLFLTGEADWIARLPRDIVPALPADPRSRDALRAGPGYEIVFFRVNVTRPPLDDPRLRRALSLAIDRRELCERIARTGEQPAWSFIPWPRPALERFAGDGPLPLDPLGGHPRACLAADGVTADDGIDAAAWGSLGHDPARARALLAEAGYRVPGSAGGREVPPIEILTTSAPLQTRTAERLQDEWRRELGIEVRIRALEEASARSARKALDYDLARSSWVGDYIDPLAFLEIFAHGSPLNQTGWSDPRYDELIDAAGRAPAGAIRSTLLFEAERLLLEEGPAIPLWYGTAVSLIAPRVEGVGGNALEWELPKRLRLARSVR